MSEQQVEKWTSNVMFPSGSSYVCRILSSAFGLSKSSKNPMITLEYEVVYPAVVDNGTGLFNVAGSAKATRYHTTKTFNDDGTVDEEKTAKIQKYVKEMFTLHGLNPDTINWDNIDVKPFENICVYAHMRGKAETRYASPTSKQIADGQAKGLKLEEIKGDKLTNPITGKELVAYYPEIMQIFGVCPPDKLKEKGIVLNPY